MKFQDILGHSNQKDILRQCVDNDHIPHALLISGPCGVGKLALARAFAQYIHCTNKNNGDSCGKCPSCLQHQSANNPDMYYVFPVAKKTKPKKGVSDDYIDEWREYMAEEPFAPYEKWLDKIDAANSQPQIFVDESANILQKINLSNFSAKYKIIIVWLPEKLKEEAANKLLKIIEEPFADTKFIFVSNEPQAILPTIYSRTQRVNIKKLSNGEIASFLSQKYGLANEDAYEIALTSDGNLNNAINAISLTTETQEFRRVFQEMMRKAYIRDIRSLKDISDGIASMGREKNRRFLNYCAVMVRENFIYNLKIAQLNTLGAEDRQFSNKFSPFINERNVERIISEIDRAESDVSRNANAKIVMFDFAIKLIILIKS